MTTAEFIKHVKDAITEEHKDVDHYMEMAKAAPTPEIRDMLYNIAKDEIMHHAKLECIQVTLEGTIGA